VLIATAIGVLVFIVESPETVSFTSDDPAKIMVKAGAIQGTDAIAQLTNATDGRIRITSISPNGASYSTCTINEETTGIDIPAGAVMELNCPLSGEDPTGAVTIAYTDFAGLERDVIIRITGGMAGEIVVLIFSQTYGGSGNDYGESFVQTPDGSYAIAGSTSSFGAGGRDFRLVKVDSSGNEEWNQTYGGTGWENGFEVLQTSDGGYAITAYTNSEGAGGYDAWLIKTDSSGQQEE